MTTGERARQRKTGDGTGQPDQRAGETRAEAEPATDEVGQRERLVELAERVRKEASRAFYRDS